MKCFHPLLQLVLTYCFDVTFSLGATSSSFRFMLKPISVSLEPFSMVKVDASRSSRSRMTAKPARLADNEKGVLYVNDRCINCSACSFFAPNTFKRSVSSEYHIVYNQPTDISSQDFADARAALSACPVGAIRSLSKGEAQHNGLDPLSSKDIELSKAYAINPKVNGISLPFPRKLATNVWMVGHHSEKTFGASPYIVKGKHGDKEISVLVDVPRFCSSAIQAVESLCSSGGPDFMFLTHVDDTAQHKDWSERYPEMKRIFHTGDLGKHNWIGDTTLQDVEILLHGESNVEDGKLCIFSFDYKESDDVRSIDCNDGNMDTRTQIQARMSELNTDFIILHTPGHSPGSISLLCAGEDNVSGTLFTGDTYAYTTRNGGHMSGFPRYGNDLRLQIETLKCLNKLGAQFDLVASGHGHPRKYILEEEMVKQELKSSDIADAIRELEKYC